MHQIQADQTTRKARRRTRANLTADGSALTNTTTETTLATHTVAANEFLADSEVEIEGSITVTSGNGNDTLTARVKLGGSTLATSPAFDVTNAGDQIHFRVVGYWRTIGASGKLVVKYANFSCNAQAAPIAGAIGVAGEITLNTTGTLACIVTGQWSAASASNSCKAQAFGYAHD